MENTNDIEVIVISSNSISTMSRGIVTALEAKGISTAKLDTRTASKEDYHNLAHVVIIVTDDMEIVDADMIAKECVKKGLKIIILGYSTQNNIIRPSINSAYLAGEFSRPVDMTKFADTVEKVLRKDNAKKKEILIIDDQPVFLRTAIGWFSEKYKVSVAPSIVKAMRVLANSKPDVILLDYEMPTITGDRAFTMLSDNPNYNSIPIIFLTSKSDREIVHKLIDLKPAGYILKTEPSEKIVSYVDKYFNKK